jgi:hypothetical protein
VWSMKIGGLSAAVEELDLEIIFGVLIEISARGYARLADGLRVQIVSSLDSKMLKGWWLIASMNTFRHSLLFSSIAICRPFPAARRIPGSRCPYGTPFLPFSSKLAPICRSGRFDRGRPHALLACLLVGGRIDQVDHGHWATPVHNGWSPVLSG